MSKVLTGQQAAEVAGLASILVDEQGDAETTALVATIKTATVACADCGKAFEATELDGSTTLCGVCYEVAGMENEVQDGLLGEESFIAAAQRMGYEGSAI